MLDNSFKFLISVAEVTPPRAGCYGGGVRGVRGVRRRSAPALSSPPLGPLRRSTHNGTGGVSASRGPECFSRDRKATAKMKRFRVGFDPGVCRRSQKCICARKMKLFYLNVLLK